MSTVVDLTFGPVPQRFPKVQFVLCESGLGWVPSLIVRADREWEMHRRFEDGLPAEPPSDIFRRSFSGTFVGDQLTMQLRELIGVERIIWGCDYPHTESPYPALQQTFTDICGGVPEPEVDLITNGNARRVFNWSKPLGQANLPRAGQG